MARVKRGVTGHARHKKVLDLAKGYVGRSSTTVIGAIKSASSARSGSSASTPGRASRASPIRSS